MAYARSRSCNRLGGVGERAYPKGRGSEAEVLTPFASGVDVVGYLFQDLAADFKLLRSPEMHPLYSYKAEYWLLRWFLRGLTTQYLQVSVDRVFEVYARRRTREGSQKGR